MVGGGRCCCLVAGAVVGGGGAHEVGESMTYRAGLSSWELTHLFCQLVQMRSVAPMVTNVVGDGCGGVVAQLLVLQWVGEGHGISRAFYWISLQHFYTSLFLLTLAPPPPFLPPVPARWSSYSFPSLATPFLLLHVSYCPLSYPFPNPRPFLL